MMKQKVPAMLRFVRWVFPKLEVVAPFLAHRYFVKIFFTPLNYRVPEKEIEWEERAEKSSIKIPGKVVQCYSWGKGPVVLVAHGWAGRATQFRKFIEPLNKRGYRVVGFDGPAHGKSTGRSTDILEFQVVLNKLFEFHGPVEAVIAHSFGGSAVLHAAMHGLPVTTLINIASPTIGDEIINTYLRAIGGSQKTADFFRAYVKKKTGKNFDEFTSLHFITKISHDLHLLLVHDENDEEVTLNHAIALRELYPSAELFQTRGLGHTRVLKDDAVIHKCVTFIGEKRLTK